MEGLKTNEPKLDLDSFYAPNALNKPEEVVEAAAGMISG